MKTTKRASCCLRLPKWSWLVWLVVLMLAPNRGLAVGNWAPITNSTDYNPGHMLLLSDGSVMIIDFVSTTIHRLTPDGQGHYLNGQWSTLNSMAFSREDFSSDVLANGMVFVAGGEHGTGGTNAEIFNPTANGGEGAWT